MDPSTFVVQAALAVASRYAQRGIELTLDVAKELIKAIFDKDPTLLAQVDIDKLAEEIHSSAGKVGQVAYDEETLARFLEIPLPDLDDVTTEDLELTRIYDHVKLEGEFREWLKDWGYEVLLGHTLMGLESIEYIPDVYGKLVSLHGDFEICINFVCDDPPDEDRVFALLNKIEAYAEAKSSFSVGDIFAVATPHRFTKGAINALGLQNKQEKYSVFPIQGSDVYALERATNPRERMRVLQAKVKEAQSKTMNG